MMKELKQLNFEQSWIIFKSDIWKTWTPEQLVFFQLKQDYLCVGVSKFRDNLAKLAKVYDYDLFKARSSPEYRQKVLKRFFVRTQAKGWTWEELIPGSLRSILKNKEGGFLAQDFSNRLRQRHETHNKKRVVRRTTRRHINS